MRRFASVTPGERFCRVAVLTRRQRRHKCGEEVIRQVEVAIPLVLLGVGPDPNRLSLLIDIPDDGRLELGDARPALVEDERGENVTWRDEPENALDVFGQAVAADAPCAHAGA
jgi:hypothetical protein